MQDSLPVAAVADDLIRALEQVGCAVLTAPPGSGKSTWLPLVLLERDVASGKKILMLEPRRLAAVSVAERLAEQRSEAPGQSVGYRIRLDSKISGQTRLEIITEGVLSRLLQSDPLLEEYGLVVFDEFHERSIQTDLGLAFIQDIRQTLRPDLKVLIMSATMDAKRVSTYLGQCPVLQAEGRIFDVSIRYEPPLPGEFNLAHVIRIVRKAVAEEAGDVLVFLPGQSELRKVAEGLSQLPSYCRILMLYGEMEVREQRNVILPQANGLRRIILSTSIAETSITVEGLRIVVDCGLSRISVYQPGRGFARLETVPVSMDAATQRAGRAGRTAPGICYRLWSRVSEANFREQRRPEIETTDLATAYLEVISWTGNKPGSFPWFDPPPQGAWLSAAKLLSDLGAIDRGGLTQSGRSLLKYPLHPRLAMMMMRSKPELRKLAAILATLFSGRDILKKPDSVDIRERVYLILKQTDNKSYASIHTQVKQLLKEASENLPTQTLNPDESGGLLMLAYPERLARRTGTGTYRQVNGIPLLVDRDDPINDSEWIIAPLTDGKSGRQQIHLAAPVSFSLLKPLTDSVVFSGYDEASGKIVAEKREQIGPFIVSSSNLAKPSAEELIRTWKHEIEQRGLAWACKDASFDLLRKRIASLGAWRPEACWPRVDDEHLIRNLHTWLLPYLGHVSTIKELHLVNAAAYLMQTLSWDQQNQIDALAPLFLSVPSGSSIPVQYYMDASIPRMSVRLQELFGMLESPLVNGGRTRVLIELLSPGYKPVQLTNDLRSFWTTTYYEVRKELRARYPKHYWPEDPFDAKGIRGTKKQNGMK